MKRHAIAFVCAFLVGCAITTPADPEHFTWDAGSPPPAVTGAGDLDNLAAIVAPLEYASDYDLSRYLSPAETLARGSGDCTAFARLWMAGFAAQGDPVRMLEMWWGNNYTGHACCLFYDSRINPAHLGWRLTSDQSVYLLPFSQDEHQAAQQGAAFLHPDWTWIKLRDDAGHLLWTMERTAP